MASGPYEYALNLLSARAYSARNLRQKLVRKEFDADEIERTMTRLAESGLIDDPKFSREFARQKLVAGGASVRRAEQDLVKRGIPVTLARESINAVVDEEGVDQLALCEKAAIKKAKSLAGVDEPTRRRRLFGFLARRGYELDDIKKVVAKIV